MITPAILTTFGCFLYYKLFGQPFDFSKGYKVGILSTFGFIFTIFTLFHVGISISTIIPVDTYQEITTYKLDKIEEPNYYVIESNSMENYLVRYTSNGEQIDLVLHNTNLILKYRSTYRLVIIETKATDKIQNLFAYTNNLPTMYIIESPIQTFK